MPNCSGGSNLNFWRKNRQVHLIIIREGPKNLPPHPLQEILIITSWCISFDRNKIRYERVQGRY